MFLKIFNWEFSYIEVWFTDQNSKPVEKEDKINITLVINEGVINKKWLLIPMKLVDKYL